MHDPEELLAYWFGDSTDPYLPSDDRMALWFGKSEAIDEVIRTRFGALHEAAAAGELDAWADEPRSRLSLVIALDQLPRNMFRATPRAFGTDALALAIAREGIERGHDRALRPFERLFVYLPLEHAEDLAHQNQCVTLMEALVEEVPAEHRPLYLGYLDYAVRHRDIIERFGRFPHRNAILGRESTVEELAFLEQPGSGF